jgi:hypothetical protein
VPAAQPGQAFVNVRGRDRERIFSIQQERTVKRDNTVRVDNRVLQIEKSRWRGTLAGCRVTVCEHLEGGLLSVFYGPHLVGRYSADGQPIHGLVRTLNRDANAA